jgi:hypothetical protein
MNISTIYYDFNILFILCSFETKMGSIFIFWTPFCIFYRFNDFCPRMAKWGVYLFIGCILLTKSLYCKCAALTRMP